MTDIFSNAAAGDERDLDWVVTRFVEDVPSPPTPSWSPPTVC